MVGWKSFPQMGYNGSVWLIVSPADPWSEDYGYSKESMQKIGSGDCFSVNY
ncbi:hypothetical protein Hanom_Chr15g01373201 [Helianthus anomalus]